MLKYIIVTEQDKTTLSTSVNEKISKNYEPLGAPFTSSWAPGHGPIHSMPENRRDEWIYLEFNQAMVYKGE